MRVHQHAHTWVFFHEGAEVSPEAISVSQWWILLLGLQNVFPLCVWKQHWIIKAAIQIRLLICLVLSWQAAFFRRKFFTSCFIQEPLCWQRQELNLGPSAGSHLACQSLIASPLTLGNIFLPWKIDSQMPVNHLAISCHFITQHLGHSAERVNLPHWKMRYLSWYQMIKAFPALAISHGSSWT